MNAITPMSLANMLQDSPMYILQHMDFVNPIQVAEKISELELRIEELSKHKAICEVYMGAANVTNRVRDNVNVGECTQKVHQGSHLCENKLCYPCENPEHQKTLEKILHCVCGWKWRMKTLEEIQRECESSRRRLPATALVAHQPFTTLEQITIAATMVLALLVFVSICCMYFLMVNIRVLKQSVAPRLSLQVGKPSSRTNVCPAWTTCSRRKPRKSTWSERVSRLL